MSVQTIVPLVLAFSVLLVVSEGFHQRQHNGDFDQTTTGKTTVDPILTTSWTVDTNGTSDDGNSTSTSLLQVYQQSQERFRTWLSDPYNHGIIMPAIIGVMAALTTVAMLCCINSCVKTSARRRRRRRIRNLADELKTDRKTLLGRNDESDDEL